MWAFVQFEITQKWLINERLHLMSGSRGSPNQEQLLNGAEGAVGELSAPYFMGSRQSPNIKGHMQGPREKAPEVLE